MPRIDPAEYESLPLHVFGLVEGFELHDVWLVELEGSPSCTIQELRGLVTADRLRLLDRRVRLLFGVRSVLGRLFRLDPGRGRPDPRAADTVPEDLADASLVPPGTPEGPFVTLYALPTEAAYRALNATVHAVLSVAVVASDSGHRFYWATYLKPVGRITSFYMRLIDPFRRTIVYPGLESWLVRLWRDREGVRAAT